jgi:hypothetical protein
MKFVVGLLMVLQLCSGTALADPEPWTEGRVRLGPDAPRLKMQWVLQVNDGAKYDLPEFREGDVPMPQGTPWKCVWTGVVVFRDRKYVVEPKADQYTRHEEISALRLLECSTDNFRTGTTSGGGYFVENGPVNSDWVSGGPEIRLNWVDASGTRQDIHIKISTLPLSCAVTPPPCTLPSPPLPVLTGRPMQEAKR